MKLGIFSYNTEYGTRPDELAKAAEERGFESFWVGEHTHIPASRDTPYPGGDPLPKPYYHMADPFVSLMAAAAATSTIKVGTAGCLVIERDPIVLAKEAATLDYLSNGRLLLGIGGGWNQEEMANHGTDFTRRWQVLRERVEAMKAIWTEEEASYEGEFVRFERIVSFPKPVQQPHPPIIYGGATPLGLKRTVRYCDGWMPIDVLLNDFPAAIADLDRQAEEAGRDPASISVSVFAFNGANEEALRRLAENPRIERAVLVAPRYTEKALPFLDSFGALTPALA